MVAIILAITSAGAIKTQAQRTAKHEMRALRARLQSLSCLRHLSVNLVGWNGVDSHVRRILDTHDEFLYHSYLEPFVGPRVRPVYWPRRWDIRTDFCACSD